MKTRTACVAVAIQSFACGQPPHVVLPPATGAITATIGVAGGTMEVVTQEGVRVHLDVPAGALQADTTIVAEPLAVQHGESFRVAFDPPGLIFRVPASLVVTLPGGGFDANTVLFARASEQDQRIFLSSAVSKDRRVLTATVTFLGNANLAPTARSPSPGSRADVNDDYWRRFFLVAAGMPLADVVGALRLLFDGLQREGRFEDSMALLSGTVMLLQRLGADSGSWEEVYKSFFNDLLATACGGLTNATQRVDALQAKCAWQARDALRDLMGMVALEQKVGAAATVKACSDTGAWRPAAEAAISRTIIYLKDKSNLNAVVACECNDPKRVAAELRGQKRRPPQCANVALPALREGAPGRKGAVYDHTTEPWEWELLLDTVSGSSDAFGALRALDVAADAQAFSTELGTGVIEAVHQHAWELCGDNQDSSILATLGKRVGALDPSLSQPAAAIFADAQHCGAALHVVAQNANHQTVATLDVAPPSATGAVPQVPPIKVPVDGTLQISGPIATLRCRDDATFSDLRLEDDRLWFSSAAGAARSPIDTRQANQANDVLAASTLPFPVDVRTQITALGLPTNAGANFNVVIERKGPGCGVQPPATTLFTVPVQASIMQVEIFDQPPYVISALTQSGGTVLDERHGSLPLAFALSSSHAEVIWTSPTSFAVDYHADVGNTYLQLQLRITVARPGSVHLSLFEPANDGESDLRLLPGNAAVPGTVPGIFAGTEYMSNLALFIACSSGGPCPGWSNGTNEVTVPEERDFQVGAGMGELEFTTNTFLYSTTIPDDRRAFVFNYTPSP